VSDPATLSLTQVAAAIRRRKLSSVELTRALLARIERWQPVLNAFVRVEADEAVAAAKAADRALARRGPKGPLHGVPLAHKDMYYFAGKPAGCGSKVREGWIAPTTSTAIARLAAAGSFRHVHRRRSGLPPRTCRRGRATAGGRIGDRWRAWVRRRWHTEATIGGREIHAASPTCIRAYRRDSPKPRCT